ncbi:hypothetical protein DACRYDRAFT_24452 [Dacryopinax primogenitus]|uniref:Uncharacterized protein n=1 Tax=Dacryopinax primogenitus (strain DJM 731) TaxID=1858805 RepID=M5FSW7_DACPD|nr:uncharacterized protein DACRYDRAFT_24452 [Dacryopinax primogenitus]EJT98399.1 hypothetical protein DACRYDRAFT_24452 [Dacryopinax primogenitus]
MYPSRSAIPPYCTFLQARLQMVRDDWTQKTTPGSQFLSSLSILSNALRLSALFLALSLLSGMIHAVPGVLPLLRSISVLQLLATFAHAFLSRWIHHKTSERTLLSLSFLAVYGTLAFLLQQALVFLPIEPRLALLVEVVRWQGWHVVLDVADITPPKESCARPSLLVSF